MKKTTKLLLTLAIISLLGALMAFSAFAEVYTGKCGGNVTYKLDTETGVLEISGTGEMTNYSSYLSVPWYSYTSYVKTVKISDGVTSIGSYAFYNCSGPQSIVIPDSVTSIGERAFGYCSSLASIKIPDGVTSIGKNAFLNCRWLTSVTIPDSVTSIGSSAFFNCSGLTSITIPEGVKEIPHQAFTYCSNLTSVYIPAGVEKIGDRAFAACEKLEYIEVDDKNANYLDIGGVVFTRDMKNLVAYPAGMSKTEYTIPDGVSIIGDSVFERARNLTSVTIGDSVTSIGDHAFYYCRSLTSVTVKTKVATIQSNAFNNCNNLKTIYCYKDSTADKFFSDTDYTKIYLDEEQKIIGDANGDGEIDIKDLVLFSQYLAGWNVSLDEFLADCNCDGKINIKDIVLLAQYLANWDVTLG